MSHYTFYGHDVTKHISVNKLVYKRSFYTNLPSKFCFSKPNVDNMTQEIENLVLFLLDLNGLNLILTA